MQITQQLLDYLSERHSTMYCNGQEVVLGQSVYTGDEMELAVASGYQFVEGSAIEYALDDGMGGQVNFPWTKETPNLATIIQPTSYSWGSSPQPMRFSVEQVDDVVGVNAVYLIDNDKLVEVNTERFQIDGNGRLLDYGQYILSVLNLPFKIDYSLIQDPEGIRLGTKNTGVQANKISTDVLVVDMGVIEVPEQEQNLLDYKGVEVVLKLPRSPEVRLEPSYVIGKEISVVYEVDVYTGVATINVFSSGLDAPIEQLEVDIGVNIPYGVTRGNTIIDNSNIVVGGENGITSPIIEINKYEPLHVDDMFTTPIVDVGKLVGRTGYFEVRNIDLKVEASSREKQEIVRLLADGVIIND